MNTVPLPAHQFKLAAIDLDGTLLGPDLKISGENLRAIGDLRKRGVEIVVASGRHYNSIAPFLRSLPEVQWVVSVQGGEVSDRDRVQVLGRKFLANRHVAYLVGQAESRGLTPLVYGIDGIYTTVADHPDLDSYSRLSGLVPRHVSSAAFAGLQVFKVIWLGEPSRMDAVMADASISSEIERVRTHLRFVEFMPPEVSKASGLEILAARLKISPGECIAFGDGDNDIPMFRWAGLSVAMDHGWPDAISAANFVSGDGSPETALARGIEIVFQKFPSHTTDKRG